MKVIGSRHVDTSIEEISLTTQKVHNETLNAPESRVNADDEALHTIETTVNTPSPVVAKAQLLPQFKYDTTHTAIIENLPNGCDHYLLASLVHGGIVESMKLESNHAYVKFARSEDCAAYIARSVGGLSLKHDGWSYVARVKASLDSDCVNNIVQACLACGATRVVEIQDIVADMTMTQLWGLATKRNSLPVECVADIYRGTRRITSFRFSCVGDAISFRDMLNSHMVWRDMCINFGRDPCADGTARV